MNTFRVIEQKWDDNGKRRKTVLETTSVTEAMDYVRNVGEPKKLNNTWELVVEGGFDDGVNANKIERTFEYENTRTGEIREYKYYIEW